MKQRFLPYLPAAGWVYFTILFGWLLFYVATGDRFGPVALVNLLAVYLFAPLPLVMAVGVYSGRMEIWLGSLLGLAVFVWFWGGLFVPSLQPSNSNGSELAVMSFNLLGYHSRFEPQIEMIRAENPDVVLFQELNVAMGDALEDGLSDLYPYQILKPASDVTGMGVISKYPIGPSEDSLGATRWVGAPQTLALDWDGRRVTVVNFHMIPTTMSTVGSVGRINQIRAEQARALVEYSRDAGPLIAGGDANAVSLNDAYAIITSGLTDSWSQAGFGLGHTFPGSDIPGSSRPTIAGWPVPMWLARIDYVFHSDHWRTEAARLARFDGVSDHRGVIARLSLK